MELTQAQKTTLKNFILADSVLGPLATGPHDNQGVADLLNAEATPAFTVWKTAVTQDEIMQNGFDWTRVDNLTNGSKWRIWEWMFSNPTRSTNPSKANVRAGIDATWVGTAQDLAVRAAVYVHCKRLASRLEKLFSTGTGSDAVPATMGLEGQITAEEVEAALIQG